MDVTTLKQQLIDALAVLGVPTSDASDLATELVARWTEPWRRYHTLGHLAAALGSAESLCKNLGLDRVQTATVAVALWFHDAVLEPLTSGGINERASADLAVARLRTAGTGDALVAAVRQAVLDTYRHDPDPRNIVSCVVSDADMASHGMPAEDYCRDTQLVREECSNLDAAGFAQMRLREIRRLLGLPFIFATSVGQQLFERVSRANLAQEAASYVAGSAHEADPGAVVGQDDAVAANHVDAADQPG